MTLSVRHLYSIDGRDASDFSTDPTPNCSCSIEIVPNSVYILDVLGTSPNSLIRPFRNDDEDSRDYSRIPSSNYSNALEPDVPDTMRIAAAFLSILSISADSTRGPREREIVRVAKNRPVSPVLVLPERIGVDR